MAGGIRLAVGQGDDRVLEFNRNRRLISAVALAAVLTVAAWFGCWRKPPSVPVSDLPIPGTEIAGQVEVLNGTDVEGLARTVTRALRLAGIDVVSFGNNSAAAESTLILVRREDTTLAVAVRSILGRGTVEMARDPTLLLDVSVVLGTDFLRGPDSVERQ